MTSAWPDVAGAVTSTFLALVISLGFLLVVVGLGRAWWTRLRTQLVINDIDGVQDHADVATAGLSSQLRQLVRRKLIDPSDAVESLKSTVGRDIGAGLVDLRCCFDDIRRMQDVQSSQRDDFAMLSAGVDVMAKDRGSAVLGALAAVLPRQRGFDVEVRSLRRELAGLHQAGLTIDIGLIGCAKTASATFWSAGSRDVHGDEEAYRRRDLADLLEPAAKWIAIYLEAGTLPVHLTKGGHRVVHPRRPGRGPVERVSLVDEERAVRAMLATQLASFEGNADNPFIVLGFADQALDDAYRALQLLPRYFRPRYLAGTIHEARGAALELAAGLVAQGQTAESAALAAAYHQRAADAFDRAAREFAAALDLLAARVAQRQDPHGRAAVLRPEYVNRRLKAALRGSRPREALDEFRSEEIRWESLEQQYNVACLYSVASSAARKLGDGADAYAQQAQALLAEVLRRNPAFLAEAVRDADLLETFEPEDIKGMTSSDRDRPSTSARR